MGSRRTKDGKYENQGWEVGELRVGSRRTKGRY